MLQFRRVLPWVLFVINSHSQLLYVNSGVYKFILAMNLPIDIQENGRALGWSINIQGLYRLPDNLTYFEPYKIVQKRSLGESFSIKRVQKALENAFVRWGMCGSDCLLQLICEIAGSEFQSRYNPTASKLVKILFTPTDDWEDHHKLAFNRGNGVHGGKILIILSISSTMGRESRRIRRELVFPQGSKFFIRLNIRENIFNYTTIFAQASGFKATWDLPELFSKREHEAKREIRNGIEDLITCHGYEGASFLEAIKNSGVLDFPNEDNVLLHLLFRSFL